MTAAEDLRCVEVVELVTAYLDGTLDAATRAAVEAHLAVCEPCGVYLEQMRATIAAVGRVPVETLSTEARSTLLEAFRDL
jgi:anti-sigma factor RsiW